MVLFVAGVHSVIDVITNSSSELFVGTGDTKEEFERLIEEVYPGYLDEYLPLRNISELSDDELWTYIYEVYGCRKEVIPGFTFSEMYEVSSSRTFSSVFLSSDFCTGKKRRERIVKALDPEGSRVFLFSISDNPNFERQEKLEEFLTRYHIG